MRVFWPLLQTFAPTHVLVCLAKNLTRDEKPVRLNQLSVTSSLLITLQIVFLSIFEKPTDDSFARGWRIKQVQFGSTRRVHIVRWQHLSQMKERLIKPIILIFFHWKYIRLYPGPVRHLQPDGAPSDSFKWKYSIIRSNLCQMKDRLLWSYWKYLMLIKIRQSKQEPVLPPTSKWCHNWWRDFFPSSKISFSFHWKADFLWDWSHWWLCPIRQSRLKSFGGSELVSRNLYSLEIGRYNFFRWLRIN